MSFRDPGVSPPKESEYQVHRDATPGEHTGAASPAVSLVQLPNGYRHRPGIPAPEAGGAITRASRPAVRWISLVGMFIVAAGITFLIVFERGGRGDSSVTGTRSGATREVADSAAADLKLHVRIEGGGLIVSWDPQASAARGSTGVLHIEDGREARDVSLDSAQISNGALFYRPSSDDVTFRLEVAGNEGRKTSTVVRVLDAAAAARMSSPLMSAVVSAGNGARSALLAPVKQQSVPSVRTTVTVDAKPLSGTTTPTTTLKTFVPRPVAANPVNAPTPKATLTPPVLDTEIAPASNYPVASSTPNNLPPPPPPPMEDAAQRTRPVTASGQTPGAATPAASTRASVVPASLTPRTGPATKAQNEVTLSRAPTLAPPNTRPATYPNVASALESYVAPRPIRQAMPSVGGRAIYSPVQIDVSVHIDKTGRVTAAQVSKTTKSDSNLETAALAAARDWRFRPAQMRNQAIEADYTIMFRFGPGSK
ncbi:MAG: TonB family protein [Acidobacteriaceae bacterium]|nr:TonB family protein [Acidobacteriaceae bacterium]